MLHELNFAPVGLEPLCPQVITFPHDVAVFYSGSAHFPSLGWLEQLASMHVTLVMQQKAQENSTMACHLAGDHP